MRSIRRNSNAGSNRANSDGTEALKLLAREIEKHEGSATTDGTTLGAGVEEFVRENPGEVTPQWLHHAELRLQKAVESFGTDRPLRHLLQTLVPQEVEF
jgi:hypothetical protein